MIMTTYEHGEEEFDLYLYISIQEALKVAAGIGRQCPQLGCWILDQCLEKFSQETATFEEFPNPDRLTVLISLSARLLLENEEEFKALGSEFLPFIVTEIHSSNMKER